MQRQIPLVNNTANNDIAGQERLVNVYPHKTDGAKYGFTLTHSEGLELFCNLPTSSVLAMVENRGILYAVTSKAFYAITSDKKFHELGTVNLNGRCVIASGQHEIVVVDGHKAFAYTFETGLVREIIDENFHPATHVAYQDGYFIFNRKGTFEVFHSDLQKLGFTGLDTFAAEGQSDNVVAIISDHRELIVFCTYTIEIWYNSGDRDQTFQRNQGAFIEKGCAAPYSVAKWNNTVYFVGSDLVVYQMSGYTPQKISSDAVDSSLRNIDLSDCFAYCYQSDGHLFYVLTIPARKLTWCFDMTTRSWHIKESYHYGRHQSNCSAFFDSKVLVGDFQTGNIFHLSSDCYTDNGFPLVREFTLPVIHNNRSFFSIDSFELDMSPSTEAEVENPQAILSISKDNGKTWSDDKFTVIGKKGNYLNRAKWNRLGVGRNFTLRVNVSDPVPLDIGGAYIEVR